MPKAKLTTKEAVQAIPHPKQGQPIWWCTELTGFGVRVGARAKTFILERRIKGKVKPVRVTLGRVGRISLHKARQDAQQLIGEMVGGVDPVARKRDQTAGGLTFAQAWKLHQATMRKKNRSQVTFDDYQAKIDAHLTDLRIEIAAAGANQRILRAIARNLLDLAKQPELAALPAIRELADRLDGKPKQESEFTMRSAIARELTDDDLAAIAVGANGETAEPTADPDPTKH
jgi:hypothetical protein